MIRNALTPRIEKQLLPEDETSFALKRHSSTVSAGCLIALLRFGNAYFDIVFTWFQPWCYLSKAELFLEADFAKSRC